MRATRGYANSFNTFGDFSPRRANVDSTRKGNKEGVEETPPPSTGGPLSSAETSVRVPDACLGQDTNVGPSRQVECGEDFFSCIPYSICTGCQRAGCTEVFQSQEAYWDHLRRYASPEQQRVAAEFDRYLEGHASEGEVQECENSCWDTEGFWY